MDRRTQKAQATAPGNPPTQPGPGPNPCPASPPQSGATLIVGRALVQTVRHFFPDFNTWLDRLPDTRVPEACTYCRRFLAWWGLLLYLLQLGSRRQLDYDLRAGGAQVLVNLNRLAQTEQTTLPVHDTLDHFLGHVTPAGWEHLRTQAVQRLGWSYVVTFKEGRTPALWQEFRALLAACPENVVRREWADGRVQEFRWVNQLAYEDSEGRVWKVNALECTEVAADGTKQYFAWLTGLPVGRKTVEEIAEKGGRDRWKVENEGFNRQKNSGLNLEHVYSTDPESWKAYYLLLQIAFIFIQLLERGSLLRRLAEELGRPVWKLFGSLKNVARRLLESVRFLTWAEDWFDRQQASRLRIGLDSS